MTRTIRFQFTPASERRAREAVRARLLAGGAADVEPLFPGEDDPELASLYTAHAADDAAAAGLVALLEGDASVAFVEGDAARRLVRPPTPGRSPDGSQGRSPDGSQGRSPGRSPRRGGGGKGA